MPAGSQSELDAEAQPPQEPSSQGSPGLLHPKAQKPQVSLGLSLGEGALARGRGAVRQPEAQTAGWAGAPVVPEGRAALRDKVEG